VKKSRFRLRDTTDEKGSALTEARSDVLHLMYGGFGGQFSVVSELSRRLRGRRLSSHACLYAPPGEFEDDGVGEGSFDGVIRVEKRHRLDLQGARGIGRVIERHRPRAVLIHVPYGLAAVRRSRTAGPTRVAVLIEHTPVELRRGIDEVRSLRALRMSDAVVFQSRDEWQKYRLRRVPIGSLCDPIVIPNGIDLDRFTPGAARTPSGAVHIGMATRMAAQKDFASLLLAVALLREHDLPSFRVTLAGDGPDRPKLEHLASELGVTELVTFVGRVEPERIVDLLQSLDAFVHATYGESVGMALLEAYGVGLPILTTDVSGVNNMVRQDVDGLMVPVDDAPALAAGLERLIREPRLRERLGRAARARAVADFGSDLMAQRYLDLLASIDPAGPWRAAS
jgi:glycosyltransferase involved in cell wall biosynthesis